MRNGLHRLVGLKLVVALLLVAALAFWAVRQSDEDARRVAGGTVLFVAAAGTAGLVGLLLLLDRQRVRDRAAARGHEQRELLAATLAGIGDGVIATDGGGRVTLLNPVAEALTGWSAGDAAGVPLAEVFRVVNEATRLPVENPALRALRGGQPAGPADHAVLLAKDGTERAVENSAAPIRDGTAAVVGAVLVFRDITTRKDAEGRLRESEERRRLALDSAGLGAWHIDPGTNSLTTDEQFQRVFAGSPGPITYDQAFALVHPGDRDRVRAAIAAATRPGDPAPYAEEYRVVRPDGSVRWVLARGRANFAGGRLASFDGTLADATDRRAGEDRLRASEDRFRTLFDSMDEGFCVIEMVLDPAGRPADYLILEANPAFEKHTGLRDAAGRRVREMVPDHDAHWFETYGRVAATGEPTRFVNHAAGMGGRWFDVFAFRLGEAADRRVAVLFNDITDRKRMEDDLRQLAADLSAADRRKDEFLATLAHELRNPLAPIRNGLQVIGLSGPNAAVEKARAMMDRQVTQLVRLVDDLLDVSRITGGKMELRTERVDLRAVLDAALETSRAVVEQAGHALAVAVPDGPLPVDGDPTRLAQVVSNLLNNSAKYTPRGGRVRLTAGRHDGAVSVSVADDGIGIPPAMLGRVFELFTQVDRTLEKTTGGLGIGLSLVKGLVGMHGGTVEARSDGEGRGSEFVVRLPLALPVAPPVAGPAPADGRPDAVPAGTRRVLVVDDNRDSADSLGQLLELLGNEVRTAHDGEAGVAAAAGFRPDVVLMDIGMPKLNGYEACRRIRGEPWGAGMVLVALTGWGQDDDRRKTAEAGFDHHLVKPVETAALMTLLAGLGAPAG